jgi:two-component system copper resistance phosphate regulon response regulator CusR
MRILFIEDDALIARQVKKGLEEARFVVDLAPDGHTGIRLALEEEYHLILLDLMLPGRDGWSVCEAVRSHRMTTPILMLTAKDAVDDRVRGLELGADDYLTKPFEFSELVARVRALLRRDKLHKTRIIRIGDLELDTASARVWRAGAEVHLTPREYQLLEALAVNEGRVLSKEAILERVWPDSDSYPDVVKVHLGTLRKKIDGEHPVRLIHTVHGFGYRLDRPAEESPACGSARSAPR